jgi:hypothetical protein
MLNRSLTPRRVWAARAIAAFADLLQWVVFPLVMGGALSPADDVIDIAVGVAMVVLVGWHWAFLPAFVAELMPFVDLAPTWTLAVWLATKDALPTRRRPPRPIEHEEVPPEARRPPPRPVDAEDIPPQALPPRSGS